MCRPSDSQCLVELWQHFSNTDNVKKKKKDMGLLYFWAWFHFSECIAIHCDQQTQTFFANTWCISVAANNVLHGSLLDQFWLPSSFSYIWFTRLFGYIPAEDVPVLYAFYLAAVTDFFDVPSQEEEEGITWTTRSVSWELIPLRYFEPVRVVRPN